YTPWPLSWGGPNLGQHFTVQAQATKISDAMAKLKKVDHIVQVVEEKLPPPPPERSAERKYRVWVRNPETDRVTEYIVFFGAPKGGRYFNLLSIRFEEAPNFDEALYGVAYLSGIVEVLCLGLAKQTSDNIMYWLADRTERIRSEGTGQFNRNFGPVTVDLAGYKDITGFGSMLLVLRP
ncbi:hypothetical protein, partial [Thermus hydrothermalis]|uniref:hypothetical protein n=1 Tax=Thermus hydrothermalis TaxID=2908148 RepID=UPI001FAB17B6